MLTREIKHRLSYHLWLQSKEIARYSNLFKILGERQAPDEEYDSHREAYHDILVKVSGFCKAIDAMLGLSYGTVESRYYEATEDEQQNPLSVSSEDIILEAIFK